MPASKGRTPLWIKAAVVFFLLQVIAGCAEWISNSCRRFSFNAGLNTLIVFQGFGLEILVRAHCAWRGNATSQVLQSNGTECAGHLLNYIVQASLFFILGGQGIGDLELRYGQPRKLLVVIETIQLNLVFSCKRVVARRDSD